MNNKTLRASNIELLRIFAMLMIIVYHIVLHCINVQLTDTTSIAKLGNRWFNNPQFYKELMFLELLMPFGLVGNALFVMISGYFLVDSEINLFKISKKLLTQLFFAAVTLVLVSAIFISATKAGLPANHLFSYIRIQYFNKMSWFVGYYFLIMLAAYLFLNYFFSKLDKKQYLGFLYAVLAISQLGWAGSLLDDLANGLRTVLIGIFLYALGGYIRRYNPFEKLRGYVFVLVIIVTNVLIAVSYHNVAIGKVQSYFYNLNVPEVAETEFVQSIPRFENYSFVVVILGVCVFELFRRIKMPAIKPINGVAKATFMIYLLHDNGFAYSIWSTQDWITLLYNDFGGFALKLALWAFAVFVVGLVAYGVFLGIVQVFKIARPLYVKKDY